ncbi:type 1 glutamine amidotransferase [Mesorhizobium sp. INR15]|uniref:type 1 glutamine amidotransferase n=1 Tax=Mesorhizobium sp. INR15 TaxID=2654248 RepID=UPI001896A080|nr:type 1 glutamine amidotransferase [Mesorhizobium sp. INR15]QPC95504.1 type 1 glutamine amidotransferase [Mesorhizobium sp. INR15]
MNRAAACLAYLDNGVTVDAVSGLPEFFANEGVEVTTYRSFDGAFPTDPAAYDGILLSGSGLSAYNDIPFIHREHGFIQEAAEAGTAMLGLCFGSQILASALCGGDQVFRRASCEVGHAMLSMLEPAATDALAGGCESRERMFVWHNDEVRADHGDMVVLAATAKCPNHIWRFRDQHIWGIQGHPELTRANAREWIGKSANALRKDGADPEQLIRETEDSMAGLGMLRKFAHICKKAANSK